MDIVFVFVHVGTDSVGPYSGGPAVQVGRRTRRCSVFITYEPGELSQGRATRTAL